MTNPSFLGYLTDPYLTDAYNGDTGLYSWGMDVNRIITGAKAVGSDVNRQIVAYPTPRGAEVRRQIVDHLKVVGAEVNRVTTKTDPVGGEVQRQIVDHLKPVGSEVQLQLAGAKVRGAEVARFVHDLPGSRGAEVNRAILSAPSSHGMELRLDHSLASWLCDEMGYLEGDYLSGPYLGEGICAQQAHQAKRILFKNSPRGMEVDRTIQGSKARAMEILLRIANRPHQVGSEVDRLHATNIGMQTRLVLYNTKLLRIMMDFPSRGTTGSNWTASSTAAGDFSVNNLNTDIVEQRWESAAADTSVVLSCDTQVAQGVPIDTVAILNHNLTSSATITAEGSTSSIFSTIQETFNIEVTPTNAYYIAPTFPTLQSRYWRFFVNDPTNPDAQLKIGTIIFGTTIVFQTRDHTDNVTRKNKHFSDKVPTEGFTNVSNDRALKRAVSLEFRSMPYDRGNFRNIVSVFTTARTSLKCLWIPDPQDPTRFAVFGKLVQIPDESHRNMGPGAADVVDLSLEVDESL
jgi:hypothetical protein